MYKLLLYIIFIISFSFAVSAGETTESLYLKLLLKKEEQIGHLNQKIESMERDISETNLLLRQLLAQQGIDADVAKSVNRFKSQARYNVKDGKLEQVAQISPSFEPVSLPQENFQMARAQVEKPIKPNFRKGFYTESAPIYARRNTAKTPIASSVLDPVGSGVESVKSFKFGDDFSPGEKLAIGYHDENDWKYRLEKLFLYG